MKAILTALGAVIFYIFWMPCAVLRDLVNTLYTPFDSERLMRTYLQTIKNARQIQDIWTIDLEEPSTTPEEKQPIGFTAYPPVVLQNPADPEAPVEDDDWSDNDL